MDKITHRVNLYKPISALNNTKSRDISFSSGGFQAQSTANLSLDNLKANFLPAKSKISFGRKLEDHLGWGATVLPDGKVRFKVWAPYADSLKLLVRDKDAKPPKFDHTPEELNEILSKNNQSGQWKFNTDEMAQNEWHYLFGKEENSQVVDMKKQAGCYYEVTLDNVKPGDMYKFVMTKEGGKRVVHLKDPRSKSQPFDIHGWSEVIDDNGYQWKSNASWENHPNRLRHKGSLDSLTPPSKMVIDEIHIGTFTEKGDFEAAMKKLEKVAEKSYCKLIISKLADIAKNDDHKKLHEMHKSGELDDLNRILEKYNENGLFVADLASICDVINHDDAKVAFKKLKHYADSGDLATLSDRFAEKAGVDIYNTVEIMPVNEFYGHKNWGYEGTDMFAAESSYGGPEKLKALVDRAHELGLNVLLDVVYNHMGPFYNVVGEFGEYFDANKGTPWGGAINYEKGEAGKRVREFVVDNSLHWLKNFNFDGLRLDMTQFMKSDIALKEIAFEIRKHKPESIVTAEDGRNTKRLVQPIRPDEVAGDDTQRLNVDEILTPNGLNTSKLKNLGFDGQWNFDFQHTLEALATSQTVMGFGPSVNDLATEFFNNFKWFDGGDGDLPNPPGHTCVNYVMSHDEAGNRDGTRLITKILQNRLGMFTKLKANGLSHAQAGQGAARVTLELTNAYVNKDDAAWDKVCKDNNINIDKKWFGEMLEQAKALNKAAIGAVFMSPGPKLMLMGDEEAELAPFKFFSEYPVYGLADQISGPGDKGYPIVDQAFKETKIGKEKYTDTKMKKFTEDLAKIFYENPALNNGERTKMTLTPHEGSRVLGVHRYEGKNEIFAVMNFGECECDDYKIKMPFGEWKQVLNSNEKQYGGNGKFQNDSVAGQGQAGHTQKTPIKLPKHSIVIFKRVS